MIAQGEDFHVAAFPGSFALHTGPRLEEPDKEGFFWGHASVRAHAQEAGAFVLSACGYVGEENIPDDFPYKGKMNVSYAHGGSSVISPLGVPLAGPEYGSQIVYAECQAAMIKAWKAIVDTAGHYARPDVLRLMVRQEAGWIPAGSAHKAVDAAVPRDPLKRAAERYEVKEETVQDLLEKLLRGAGDEAVPQ